MALTKYQDPNNPNQFIEVNPDFNDVSKLTPFNPTISASTLATPTTPLIVPPVPTPTTPDLSNGQATIDYFNKLFTNPESKPQELTSLFDKYLKTSSVQEGQQDVLAKQTASKVARDKLAAINAQLAGITAEAQAVPIRQEKEAVGRRSVEATERLSRAELRDVALRALPLQAQALAAQAEVASAQGDVELSQRALSLAQDKFNTLFQVVSKDTENTYNYWKDLREKAFNFADKTQQRELDKAQKEDDRKYQAWVDDKNQAQANASALLSTQPELASKILARIGQTTGINDTTLASDVASLVGQAKAKVELLSVAEAKALGVPFGTTKGQAVGIMPKTDLSNQNQIILPKIGTGGNDIKFTPSSSLTAQQKLKVNTVVAGIDLMKKAEELYKEATGNEYSGMGSGVLSRLKGLGRLTGALVGTNEKWQAYQNFLDSNRAPIAKGIKGEVGNLAEQEQKNALKSFPGRFSSPYEAKVAFEAVRSQALSNVRTLGSIEEIQTGSQESTDLTISQEQLQELKDAGLL